MTRTLAAAASTSATVIEMSARRASLRSKVTADTAAGASAGLAAWSAVPAPGDLSLHLAAGAGVGGADGRVGGGARVAGAAAPGQGHQAHADREGGSRGGEPAGGADRCAHGDSFVVDAAAVAPSVARSVPGDGSRSGHECAAHRRTVTGRSRRAPRRPCRGPVEGLRSRERLADMSAPAVSTRPHVVVVGGGIAGLDRRAGGARGAALGRGDGARGQRPPRRQAAPRAGRRAPRRRRRRVGARPCAPRPSTSSTRVGAADDLVAPATTAASVWSRGALLPLPRGHPDGGPERPGLGPRHPHRRRGRAPSRTNSPGPRARSPRTCRSATTSAARLGDAVVDRLVEPLLGGVYAGHARRLSLQATMPVLWARATRGESLVDRAGRGPASAAGERRPPAPPTAVRRAATAGSGDCPSCVGRRGRAARRDAAHRCRRPRAAAHRHRVAARRSARPPTPRWSTPMPCVVCRPRGPAARLLAAHAPVAAAALGGVETASSAVVTLAVERTGLERAARLGVPRAAGRGPHHQGEHLQLPQVGLDRRAVRRRRAPARLVRPGPRGGRPAARRRRPGGRRRRRGRRGPRPPAAPRRRRPRAALGRRPAPVRRRPRRPGRVDPRRRRAPARPRGGGRGLRRRRHPRRRRVGHPRRPSHRPAPRSTASRTGDHPA